MHHRYTEGNKPYKIPTFTKSVFMLISGIIAGWTNENTVAAILCMILLWLLYHKKLKHKIPAWSIWGFTGAVTGFLFMTLAPGNYVRLNTVGIPSYGPSFLFFQFMAHTAQFWKYTNPILLTTLILSIITLRFKTIAISEFIPSVATYIIVSFIALYAMTLSPQFPGRAFFGLITFVIIAFGIAYYNLNIGEDIVRYIKAGITTLFIMAFLFNFYEPYKQIQAQDTAWENMHKMIHSAIVNNIDKVVLDYTSPPSKYVVANSPSRPFDEDMSLYYNIKIVVKE
jgi:hypothetical protein